MNPSGRNTQPFGLSTQNSQRMTSSSRFHPYTTTTATAAEKSNTPGQSFGGRLPLTSSASPNNRLAASAASAQHGALLRFNMPVGNATINYPALPRSAGYSRPASNNYQNPMPGRYGPTPMRMPGPSYVGVSQDRAFPSQPWQASPMPSASQMMPCAGGDAFSLVQNRVTSPNKQGKGRVNKGNPVRSQGLRVLSGRVGKVRASPFQL